MSHHDSPPLGAYPPSGGDPAHRSGSMSTSSSESIPRTNSQAGMANRGGWGLRRDSSSNGGHAQPLEGATLGVLSGQIGSSFGPFPRSSTYSSSYNVGQTSTGTGSFVPRRESFAPSSSVAIDLGGSPRSPNGGGDSPHQQLLPPSSPMTAESHLPYNRYSTASFSTEMDSEGPYGSPGLGGSGTLYEPDASLLWTKENVEPDDYLHNTGDPALERMLDKQVGGLSPRGLVNVSVLAIVIIVIVGLFAGWPIYSYAIHGEFPNSATSTDSGWGLGGVNATGQVPKIEGLPGLIDDDTPMDVRTRTGFDGKKYDLVFSDEFNVDGRTFWPGDDPYWEALDLWYWGTKDYEWYDPDAITTRDGKLEIELTQEPTHGLNFRSGMLTTWNKICFQGGYIEVSMSMPGTPTAMGYWPGVWTLGNLGRPGYGATNEGTWPYSYNSCDVGTMPNQTYPNGTVPDAAKTSGSRDYGGELSWLPGQRLSACTCEGEDHPGPNVGVGRGAPEIDINEMQVHYTGVGSASQSIQVAPMDAGYIYGNSSSDIINFNSTRTLRSEWQGSVYQESLSYSTFTDATSYDGRGYTSYGVEFVPGDSGRITWAMNSSATWQMNSAALGPNEATLISQRPISEEPMQVILNLAIAESFQPPEWGKLTFPGTLRIDYVRVYQTGKPKLSCDPDDHPTADYIQRHMDAYTNPNVTTWEQAGKTWPKNSMSREGCN